MIKKMYIGVQAMYPLFLSDFNNFLERFSKISSNITFHENLSGGSRVVPCGRTDGQTNRHDKANSRFRNSAHAPKKN